jgi:hypothetical protein
MSDNTDLMRLGSGATREMIRLPQHGWRGSLSAPVVRKPTLAWLLKKLENASLPLDFHAFNRFHHGGKVRDQDLQVMQNCLATGLARGHKMSALGELVARYQMHCAAVS